MKKFSGAGKGSALFMRLRENDTKTQTSVMYFQRLSILALSLLTTAASCKKDDGDNCPTTQEATAPSIAPGGCVVVDPCAEPCDGDVVCTAMFAAVSVTAVDAANTPLEVDSFVVTDLAGTPLPPVNGEPVYGIIEDGRFTIVNDGWMQWHQGMQMPVQAKGFLNGTLLFDQAYTIGADCCHVYKAAGPDVIAIQ